MCTPFSSVFTHFLEATRFFLPIFRAYLEFTYITLLFYKFIFGIFLCKLHIFVANLVQKVLKVYLALSF